MINKITNIGHICLSPTIDEEHLRIIRKLYEVYGIRSSGSKSVDKAILRQKELEDAEKENCVSAKFLVIGSGEQEKIHKEKKDKKIEANPELYENTTKGQKLLGEQIMLTIKMKQKK